jgi:hypothetical protein
MSQKTQNHHIIDEKKKSEQIDRQSRQSNHTHTHHNHHQQLNTSNTNSRSSQSQNSNKSSRIMSLPQSPSTISDITVIDMRARQTPPPPPSPQPQLTHQDLHRNSVTHQNQNQNQNQNTFYSNNSIYVSETDLYNSKNRLVAIPNAALLANSRYLPLFIRDRDILRIGSHWSAATTHNNVSLEEIIKGKETMDNNNHVEAASSIIPVYIHELDCLKIEHESVCVYICEKDLQQVVEKYKVDFFKSTSASNTPWVSYFLFGKNAHNKSTKKNVFYENRISD